MSEAEKRVMKRAIGLMSGTSADGVDAALIETDGIEVGAVGPYHFVDYSGEERARIQAAMQAVKEADSLSEREALGAEISELVTLRHIAAVEGLLERFGRRADGIDVIGFHGQTLFHDASLSYTLQVGDAAALAKAIGVPVVYHMRHGDLGAGGQGAPLVPIYHKALAVRAGLELPAAVVNIGGVANVTYVGAGVGCSEGADLLAFDTGPGNVLLDEWVGAKTGARFDDGGRLAARGAVNEAVLGALLAAPYLKEKPPKSLDRYDFDFGPVAGLSVEDGAATLTEFTAQAIVGARAFMRAAPKVWVIVGGGVRNDHLMARLSSLLEVPVISGEALDWSPAYVEAEAFGFLAVRHLSGLPLTFPLTTGVQQAQTGGVLAMP